MYSQAKAKGVLLETNVCVWLCQYKFVGRIGWMTHPSLTQWEFAWSGVKIWYRLASPDVLQRARWSRNYNFEKKSSPPPLETRQFCFLYPFVSVFETQKVLCKKAVRKDKNWFSADLPTPKRQKYWDSEQKLGKVVKGTEKWKKSGALNFLRVISDVSF